MNLVEIDGYQEVVFEIYACASISHNQFKIWCEFELIESVRHMHAIKAMRGDLLWTQNSLHCDSLSNQIQQIQMKCESLLPLRGWDTDQNLVVGRT